MQIDGAIIREQGQTFGVILVKQSAIRTQTKANEVRRSFQTSIRDFQGIPLILASQDSFGRFTYNGRKDIVRFLVSIHPSRIPWKRYSVS